MALWPSPGILPPPPEVLQALSLSPSEGNILYLVFTAYVQILCVSEDKRNRSKAAAKPQTPAAAGYEPAGGILAAASAQALVLTERVFFRTLNSPNHR